MNIDIVILSYAKNEDLKFLTQQTVDTLIASEDPSKIEFNVLVYESNKELAPYQFPGSTTIYPKEKFNFNKYLNLGIKATNSPYICFCNNDLIFYRGWATRILDTLKRNPDLLSVSPYCPDTHTYFEYDSGLKYGYDKIKYIAGWCIFVKRDIFKIIGLFDENFKFWYSDNDYAKTLEKFNLKHAVDTSSTVKHLGQQTLNDDAISNKERRELTKEQRLYFDFKWNHRSRILYSLKYIKMRLKQTLKI